MTDGLLRSLLYFDFGLWFDFLALLTAAERRDCDCGPGSFLIRINPSWKKKNQHERRRGKIQTGGGGRRRGGEERPDHPVHSGTNFSTSSSYCNSNLYVRLQHILVTYMSATVSYMCFYTSSDESCTLFPWHHATAESKCTVTKCFKVYYWLYRLINLYRSVTTCLIKKICWVSRIWSISAYCDDVQVTVTVYHVLKGVRVLIWTVLEEVLRSCTLVKIPI